MGEMPAIWGLSPQYATLIAWFVWFVSWMVAALWSARAAKRVDWNSQFLYRLVTIVGAYLLFGVMTHSYRGPGRLWILNETESWALVGVVVFGFLFAWWARIYLGSLWSGWITKKADHHIVDTGPYALVRHPIYTGLIISAFATAIQRGTICGAPGCGRNGLGLLDQGAAGGTVPARGAWRRSL